MIFIESFQFFSNQCTVWFGLIFACVGVFEVSLARRIRSPMTILTHPFLRYGGPFFAGILMYFFLHPLEIDSRDKDLFRKLHYGTGSISSSSSLPIRVLKVISSHKLQMF